MNPRFPIYIPSKGRADTRITIRYLQSMGVPFKVVVEEQEYEAYAAHLPKESLLILDPEYQRQYETCDELGDTKSKGPGPARNFAWDHSISLGAEYHWVMDDNIFGWYRLNKNRKNFFADGTCFRIMEDFTYRYCNAAMSGPAYEGLTPRREKHPPFILNTRIYSCNLIRNDVPFRWRGRYNEDTDLSLKMLKAGWCTIQFFAILQQKVATQRIQGGNTEEFYRHEGTLAKSQMMRDLHPDVARLVWKFNRWHHHVDYRPFKSNALRRREGVVIGDGINEYGMSLKAMTKEGWPGGAAIQTKMKHKELSTNAPRAEAETGTLETDRGQPKREADQRGSPADRGAVTGAASPPE